ncbi:MAG: NAD-dependent DNA ligase LigA [Clostridia bacterium]
MKEEQISFFEIDNNNENDIKKELDKLRKEIEYHNKLYYEQDEPEISDYEYDKLTQRLRQLEKEHPELVTKNSPSQKVGGKTKNIFTQVVHDVQMQSLQDVFSLEDVEGFVDKVKEEFGEKTDFCVETKIDGLSVSLEYENGILVRGSTRGDGFVGEDVTPNIKMIKDIPQRLNTDDTIEVRGEVYLPRKEFESINEKLLSQNKQQLSNPRNAAAGTLRQLDSNLVKDRNLSIFVFNVQKGMSFEKHSESLDYLDKVGMKTIALRFICKTKEEVINAINKIGNMRDELEYDIDGAVVKVNNLLIRQEMGQTIKVPKWAVAYKYPPEQRETKVLDIVLQVGRTGQVTPVVILEPVRVAGSIISKTTLHNFDFMQEKDIRIGDTVVIQKAGDVIPEVYKVLKEKRDGSQKSFVIPKVCPVCGEELEKEGEEVALRCTNSECPAQTYRSITHFVSRDCMDISGMGDAIVETLIDKNLLKDITDIYTLKFEDFYSLEGFKEKSSRNLIESIEKSKENSLDKLLFGLGIRHIGKKASKILAENFDDIYKLAEASVEELNSLEDFGTIMAESVYSFFKKPQTIEIIKKLDKFGVNLKGNKLSKKSELLLGKTICITGSFDNYSRDDIVKMIEENSGKASSSVSKKTNYLIAGESAGSKLTKAQELGVEVISLEEFLNIIKEGDK